MLKIKNSIRKKHHLFYHRKGKKIFIFSKRINKKKAQIRQM
ncbi:hypothetical protein HMPREF0653_01256 [Prevotella disiens JCM 6334 = ATCC 29426]|uniref:Uncharacterized protein n=2 Tax=Prevotella disiens TaxID=28130 RepID=E1KPD2_9BACT|nr:hypothetical protein HMPREF9296_0359 [Prevotella disiens FB035-09AN]ERJ77049.1 hypothetical protein HMPREF0653_01256 [Prevotella disiens JCM 6334 = ATCC 29426]